MPDLLVLWQLCCWPEREGVKTLIIEKEVKAGGGMWQGGMLMPKIVIEEPANIVP